MSETEHAPRVASAPALDALHGVRYGFFGSRGGVSTGIFESLNAGHGSRDDPAAITENRRRVAAAVGVGEPHLLSVFQIHSDEVVTVDRPWTPKTRPRCDAMVTNRPGVALGVLAADCGPVLFADADAGVVGAAHSGWKGAVTGVLGNTVQAMERLGARRERIVAALGPCIRQESYEVGPEFLAAFLTQDAANERYFTPNDRAGHFQFDLGGYVMARLADEGLAAVHDTELDTYANPDRLFSYRLNTHKKVEGYGRNISAICLSQD